MRDFAEQGQVRTQKFCEPQLGKIDERNEFVGHGHACATVLEILLWPLHLSNLNGHKMASESVPQASWGRVEFW
jgi:hypothetical protein